LLRHGEYSKTRTQRKNVQKRRIARKVYGKKIVWMVRQTIQPRILGKVGKELEMVERKKIRGKKNRNNHRGRRSRSRKFRS